MKVFLSETELISIIRTSLEEQELEGGTEGAGVETGVSDAGGTGAKQWESGLTRGPANPAALLLGWYWLHCVWECSTMEYGTWC